MRPVEESFRARAVLPLCEPQLALLNQEPEFAYVTAPTAHIGSESDVEPTAGVTPQNRTALSTESTILNSSYSASATRPLEETRVEKNGMKHSGSKKQRLLPTWAMNGCKGESGLCSLVGRNDNSISWEGCLKDFTILSGRYVVHFGPFWPGRNRHSVTSDSFTS